MDSPVPTLISEVRPVELVASTIAQLNRIILGKERPERREIARPRCREEGIRHPLALVGRDRKARARPQA